MFGTFSGMYNMAQHMERRLLIWRHGAIIEKPLLLCSSSSAKLDRVTYVFILRQYCEAHTVDTLLITLRLAADRSDRSTRYSYCIYLTSSTLFNTNRGITTHSSVHSILLARLAQYNHGESVPRPSWVYTAVIREEEY